VLYIIPERKSNRLKWDDWRAQEMGPFMRLIYSKLGIQLLLLVAGRWYKHIIWAVENNFLTYINIHYYTLFSVWRTNPYFLCMLSYTMHSPEEYLIFIFKNIKIKLSAKGWVVHVCTDLRLRAHRILKGVPYAAALMLNDVLSIGAFMLVDVRGQHTV
jgi:hypothetical protein